MITRPFETTKHVPLFAEKINNYERYVAPCEIGLISGIYVGGIASHDHYTWWSLALVWLYIVAVAAESWSSHVQRLNLNVVESLWLAPFISALVVVLGVIIMSAVPCSLLEELYHENGPMVYTSGNFFVHYYPLLRLIFFAPLQFKTQKPLVFVLHLILVYTLSFNPNDIYGCVAMSSSVTVFLLCAIPLVLLSIAVMVPVASFDWTSETKPG